MLPEFLAAYKQARSVAAAEKESGYQLMQGYPPAGFYVYALIDPRDDSIFYIGKGIGERVLKHEERTRRGVIQNKQKVARIQQIYADGKDVIKRTLFVTEHEDVALSVEDDLIHELRDMGLTNILGGSAIQSQKVRAIAESMREKIAAFRAALVADNG